MYPVTKTLHHSRTSEQHVAGAIGWGSIVFEKYGPGPGTIVWWCPFHSTHSLVHHGPTHARVLTSATPVGERFWNLKIGKSGFKEATAQPLGSVAHRQSHDHGPGLREVGSRVTTSAITYSDEIHNLGCSQAHSVKL